MLTMSKNKLKKVQTNKYVKKENNNTRTGLLVTTEGANSLLKSKLTDFIAHTKKRM